MAVTCVLQKYMEKPIDLSLSERRPLDMSSVDMSKCPAVYEDGIYDIFFQCGIYPLEIS